MITIMMMIIVIIIMMIIIMLITLIIIIIKRKKFSPFPGIEPGSPALGAGAITTKPPRRSAMPSKNSSLIGFPLTLRKH